MDRADRTTFPLTRAALAGAFALTLAGCGDDPAPKPAAKAPPPAPTAPRAEAMPAPAKPDPAATQQTADATLAGRVKAALVAEPLLNAHGIDVVARNGAVTLFGTAESTMKRDMAENVAKAIPGVKTVENRLAIVAGS